MRVKLPGWQTPSPYRLAMAEAAQPTQALIEAQQLLNELQGPQTPRRRLSRALPDPGCRLIRVGGRQKLDRLIADFDPEGDPINGFSDRR